MTEDNYPNIEKLTRALIEVIIEHSDEDILVAASALTSVLIRTLAALIQDGMALSDIDAAISGIKDNFWDHAANCDCVVPADQAERVRQWLAQGKPDDRANRKADLKLERRYNKQDEVAELERLYGLGEA